MIEIAEVEPNGFTVVSTFSGCGGSCLGYRMAGYRIGWASEFVPAAQGTYRANASPSTILDTRDIRDVQPAEILDALGLAAGELDLFEGSPPCASFSTAGKREAHWGETRAYSDTKQRTDDLFFEFARLLEGMQPRVFTAENVSGLVKGTAKGYFKEILARLKKAGYRVEVKLLDASWLGVPQARQRIFFQGVRTDLGMAPAWPRPLPYRYTVRDALTYPPAAIMDPAIIMQRGPKQALSMSGPDNPAPTVQAHGLGDAAFTHQVGIETRVIHDTSGERSQGDITDTPAPTITPGINSVNAHHFQVIHDTSGQYSEGDITDRPAPMIVNRDANYQVPGSGLTRDPETGEDITIGRYAIGKEWARMRQGSKSGKYLNLTRPHEDAPLPTVTQTGHVLGAASVTHWAECRKLTLGELRRLGGFPDDFELTGSYSQRWERIGRAVPPVMMFHLAAAIRDRVLIPLREAGRI